MVNPQNGGGWAFYTDTTTAVTVSGNMVSFEDNSGGSPKQVVYIGYPVRILEK
jgi:hypothetical protein